MCNLALNLRSAKYFAGNILDLLRLRDWSNSVLVGGIAALLRQGKA